MFKLLKNFTKANDERRQDDLSVPVSATSQSVSKQTNKQKRDLEFDNEAIVTHFVRAIDPVHQLELQMVTKKKKRCKENETRFTRKKKTKNTFVCPLLSLAES